MNVGLFALLAGFLLPLALCIRLGVMIGVERWRGWSHPLNLVLWTELLLAAVPVVALTPSAWLVVSGDSIEERALLLDFTASGWGLAKLVVSTAAVLLADVAFPRVYDQLVLVPTSTTRPTPRYLVRDLGVLAICLALALAAAVLR